MHNTTGTCQHNGLPLWLVLCLEERPGASELFEPDEGPAYLLHIENASRITLVAWLNTMFSQSKSYIIPMPPILKGVLYSYSKSTANIAHQSKKNSVFYLTSLKKPKGDIWFGTTPIGHSTLSKTMKCLCDAVGIGGF